MYSIKAQESYSEYAIRASGFKARLFFTKSSWGIITLVFLILAGRVISAIRSFRGAVVYDMVFINPQKFNLGLS